MSSAKPLDELRRRLGNAPAPGAFAALAEEHRRAGRLDEAVAVCREGLARYPTYVSARVTLGRALLDVGDTAVAIDELEQAVAQAPDNLAAVRALESARAIAAEAPGAAPAEGPIARVAPDLAPTDASADGADQAAPASALDWLTVDAAPPTWPAAAAVAPPEPTPAALDTGPTAWDETIYAPIRPFAHSPDPPAVSSDDVVVVDADADAAEWAVESPTSWFHREDAQAAVTIPASHDAPASLGDDVMAFPAFRTDGWEPTAPPEGPNADLVDARDEAPAVPLDASVAGDPSGEAHAADPDPLAMWAGFADAPAHGDGVPGWHASVDAVVDEVFDRAARTSPAADDADGVADVADGFDLAPAAIAPDLAVDSAAGSAVVSDDFGVIEVSPTPLQTLEALLVAIRERRAALGNGRADVD